MSSTQELASAIGSTATTLTRARLDSGTFSISRVTLGRRMISRASSRGCSWSCRLRTSCGSSRFKLRGATRRSAIAPHRRHRPDRQVCVYFRTPLPICVSDFCIPLRTVLPGPPAPPAPPIADAFVLSLEANPALCVTVVPGGTHPRVVLAVCSAGHKAQAWLQQATNGDDLGIVAASITGKGGSFLKVAEKDYPKGHACDPGDALTIGGATSGKVHTYFTWQAAAPEVNAGPLGLGRLLCAGCEGMCAGAGTNMTELVGCTGGTAELVGRGWHA